MIFVSSTVRFLNAFVYFGRHLAEGCARARLGAAHQPSLSITRRLPAGALAKAGRLATQSYGWQAVSLLPLRRSRPIPRPDSFRKLRTDLSGQPRVQCFRQAAFFALSIHMCVPKRFVYLLQSLLDRQQYYVGLTSDPVTRLAAHNAGDSPHTARCRPWRVLVTIEFSHAERAKAFERYLKSGSGREFARRHFRQGRQVAYPAPHELQLIGDEWVKSGTSAVLEVPSTVIDTDSNYLLNPPHHDFQAVRVMAPQPFEFDLRLPKS
jgi:putative endonuclease